MENHPRLEPGAVCLLVPGWCSAHVGEKEREDEGSFLSKLEGSAAPVSRVPYPQVEVHAITEM